LSYRNITPNDRKTEIHSDFFRRRNAAYQNWRPQGTDDCLLIYTVSGSGLMMTPSGATRTRPGDATLYFPGELHDYSTDPAVGRWDLLWAHFTPKPHWQHWLKWPVNSQKLKLIHLQTGETRREFVQAMRNVVRLPRLQVPQAIELASNALEAALLWAHVSISNESWFAMDSRVRKAIDFLALNFRAPFHMETLARTCGLSSSRLAHLFKDETGTSPQQFVERQRIREACTLLRITSQDIGQIAAQVGYDDPFYFSKRFRRHMRKSPTQFRGGEPVVPKGRAGLLQSRTG
jgi:AraC family transcriptional regulator, arabinose operon regulatory protein